MRDYKAWLDEDGKHVWFMHDCVLGKETSMLPYPTWKATEDGLEVTPSIVCNDCGFHEMVSLLQKQAG